MNRICFDIDTQLDFVMPAGALYAPGSERLALNLRLLTAYCSSRSIPLLSTMDAHSENDIEFRAWPHHCVAGTLGQRKLDCTLFPQRSVIPSTAGWKLSTAPQMLIEKQTVDCFTNPNLVPLLEALRGDSYFVYGVVTEICVFHAIDGLLRLGKPVTIIADAVQSFDNARAADLLKQLRAKGLRDTTAAEFCA